MFHLPALSRMPAKYTLALDLEISNELTERLPYQHDISCLALHVYQPPDPTKLMPTIRLYNEDGSPLQAEQILLLMDWLQPSNEAVPITTFNGMGFDWPVIGHVSGHMAGAIEIAVQHVDLMLCYVWGVGWPTRLDASLKQMGLESKAHDVTDSQGNIVGDFSGALAPEYWRKGEHELVLTYLDRDVAATAELHCAALRLGKIKSASAAGRPNQCMFNNETAQDLLRKPWPKAEWLRDKGENPYKFATSAVEWMLPAIKDTTVWKDPTIRSRFYRHFPSFQPLVNQENPFQ